jgi:hypothetical protein
MLQATLGVPDHAPASFLDGPAEDRRRTAWVIPSSTDIARYWRHSKRAAGLILQAARRCPRGLQNRTQRTLPLRLRRKFKKCCCGNA